MLYRGYGAMRCWGCRVVRYPETPVRNLSCAGMLFFSSFVRSMKEIGVRCACDVLGPDAFALQCDVAGDACLAVCGGRAVAGDSCRVMDDAVVPQCAIS